VSQRRRRSLACGVAEKTKKLGSRCHEGAAGIGRRKEAGSGLPGRGARF